MERKTLLGTIKPGNTVEDLDKIAEQIHSGDKQAKLHQMENEEQQHRLTIDLPKWLIKIIKEEGKKNGQTTRGVILASLLNIFKK